jgi:hypothetical protein
MMDRKITATISLQCIDLNNFQIFSGRRCQYTAINIETRTMAWAIPTALGIVPGYFAFDMSAGWIYSVKT